MIGSNALAVEMFYYNEISTTISHALENIIT